MFQPSLTAVIPSNLRRSGRRGSRAFPRQLAAEERSQRAMTCSSARPSPSMPSRSSRRWWPSEVTPVKHFYVRNHGPMPKVDAADFKLRIEGLVHEPRELTLAEVPRSIPSATQEATLTCAGNRRQEMSAIKPVAGVQWDAGAIGHAAGPARCCRRA